MNLDTLIRSQNRQWLEPKITLAEKGWQRRNTFFNEIKRSLNLHLILAVTGLRRVGKSTLMKQLLAELFDSHPAENLFYFSFDGALIKSEADTLTGVIETYANYIFHKPANQIDKPAFIFLDEIQLIPNWQDVLKRYYDMNRNLKFIISGSSSLFISKKSTESLAGRIKEFFLPPLTFSEYLNFHPQISHEIEKLPRQDKLNKYTYFFPDQLSYHFELYLQFGQFPQPVVENFPETETLDYLYKIESKVIEYDLPKTFPIKRPDILKIIFAYCKNRSGSLLSYDQLTNDLGVDIRTTISYIDWLQKAFLVNLCLNQTKKIVKASRTQKKIYLTSTNFSDTLALGAKVETYIFNILKLFGFPVEFYRFQNQEVDFITTTNTGKKIPWEVKYSDNFDARDERAIRQFAVAHNSPCAFLITKQVAKEPSGKPLIYHIPASQIEERKEAIIKKHSL